MCEGRATDRIGANEATMPEGKEAAPSCVGSSELLQGRKELLIHHAGQIYRLRVTASNKLILMK